MSFDGMPAISSEQERIWRACMLRPDAAYNIASGVRIHGAMNIVSVRQSVEHVMRRHESLRSWFVEEDAQAIVKVTPAARLPLLVVDVAGLDEQARARTTLRLKRCHAGRMLPWNRPPLLAGIFVTAGEPGGYLSCVIHHLLSDSWSMIRFFGELAQIYTRFVAGAEAGLQRIRFGYFDYARRQSDWETSDACARQGRFWQESLTRRAFRPLWEAGIVAAAGSRSRGGIVEVRLPRAVRAQLRGLERKWRLTLFMMLEAGLHLAIQKWTGERASRIAAVDASRSLPETEPLIGPFANLLLLEAHHDPGDTVEQFFRRVAAVTAKAVANREYPFGKVREMLDPGRTTPIDALFQVALVLQGLDVPKHRPGNVPIEIEDVYNGAAKFPLTVYARDEAGEIRLTAEYATDRFDAMSVRALLAKYTALLRCVCDRPAASVADLVTSSPPERHWAVHEVNDTAAEAPADRLVELFEARARERPDRIALQSGDRSLTFATVARLARAVGRDLKGLSAVQHECVGVFFDRSPELVIAMLGVLSAGCVFMPLNPEHPAAATRRRIETSGVTRILCKREHAPRVLEMGGRPVVMDDSYRLQTPIEAPRAGTATHPEAMYVMFTSGSTGEPKGAVLPSAGVSNRIAWMRDFLDVDERDRVLFKTPITFDVSVWEVFLPLASGCTLVVAAAGEHRDSRKIAALIVDQQITIIHLVPSMAVAFCDEPAARRCASLRHVVLSGEALSASLLARLRATVAARIHNLYGPTEASIDVTAWTAGPPAGARPPIGRPIWNIVARILDERLEPVASGIEGELYLGGVGVALGYVNAPRLTAAAFVPDPLSSAPGARLYRTGDRARLRPDGNVEFIGRRDGQVKLNGIRIELGEIEEALRRHPAVADAAVVAVSNPDGAPRLECFAVAKPQRRADIHARLELSDALLRFVRDELPYGASISGVVFLDQLPRSPSGKTDKRALTAMIESGEVHALWGGLLSELEEMTDEDAARLLARVGGPASS